MSENIEIVIKIPINSPLAKELITVLSKTATPVTVERKEVITPSKKVLSAADQKKLQELKALLEIATVRGQTSLIKETEAQIRQLEE